MLVRTRTKIVPEDSGLEDNFFGAIFFAEFIVQTGSALFLLREVIDHLDAFALFAMMIALIMAQTIAPTIARQAETSDKPSMMDQMAHPMFPYILALEPSGLPLVKKNPINHRIGKKNPPTKKMIAVSSSDV